MEIKIKVSKDFIIYWIFIFGYSKTVSISDAGFELCKFSILWLSSVVNRLTSCFLNLSKIKCMEIPITEIPTLPTIAVFLSVKKYKSKKSTKQKRIVITSINL